MHALRTSTYICIIHFCKVIENVCIKNDMPILTMLPEQWTRQKTRTFLRSKTMYFISLFNKNISTTMHLKLFSRNDKDHTILKYWPIRTDWKTDSKFRSNYACQQLYILNTLQPSFFRLNFSPLRMSKLYSAKLGKKLLVAKFAPHNYNQKSLIFIEHRNYMHFCCNFAHTPFLLEINSAKRPLFCDFFGCRLEKSVCCKWNGSWNPHTYLINNCSWIGLSCLIGD